MGKRKYSDRIRDAVMKFEMKALAPFDFDLSASIFSQGDGQIRRYENGRYWQVVRVNGKLALVVLRSVGAVNNPRLAVELKSNREISDDDRRIAGEIVRSLFNLEFDLKPFYEDVAKDTTMSKLVEKLRGLRAPTTETPFEALIDSIVEQQISLKVAHGLENKLIKTFGDILRLDDQTYYAYPTPKRLASAGVEQIRKCSLTLRKAEYIHGVSASIRDGELDLDKLKNQEDEAEILDELCKIRGVGVWTAELTMVRGMSKTNVFPADDVGLRRVVSNFYRGGTQISPEQARRIADKWGRWKGLASFYLILAESRGVEN